MPKPNATLLLYPGLGPAMLRRLRRESLPVSIGGAAMFTLAPDKKKIYPNICLFYILINEIFISYIYWNSSHWSDSFSYHKTSYIVIYRGEPSWFHSRVTCSHNQLVSSHWPRSIDSSSSTWLLDSHMHVKGHTHVCTCTRQKKKSILTYAYSIFW